MAGQSGLKVNFDEAAAERVSDSAGDLCLARGPGLLTEAEIGEMTAKLQPDLDAMFTYEGRGWFGIIAARALEAVDGPLLRKVLSVMLKALARVITKLMGAQDLEIEVVSITPGAAPGPSSVEI